jgi:hypothetical protein
MGSIKFGISPARTFRGYGNRGEKTMKKNYQEGIPDEAYLVHPENGRLIKVVAGESGYYPMTIKDGQGLTAQGLADKLNGGHLDEAVAEAMLVGSMFGWLVPGASPNCYRKA